MRTGSNPPDINRFRMNMRRLLLSLQPKQGKDHIKRLNERNKRKGLGYDDNAQVNIKISTDTETLQFKYVCMSLL